jgi:alpha-mannosidase
MREWESFWSHEFGWPRYSEYRHLLQPHGKSFSNAARVRAAEGFSQKLLTVVDQAQTASLPLAKSFATISPENAHLTVFRKKENQGFELRTVDIGGKEVQASIQLAMPVASASETNLLGKKIADVSSSSNKLTFGLHPWRVNTFEIL